jgi:adenylate kinase
MNILLLGAQASGEGTQAELLTRVLSIPHISSGDLFREEIEKQSMIGKRVQRSIEHGELVPDDLTVAMVLRRLQRSDCAKGALLDGFPRTLAQAKAFDEELSAYRQQVGIVISLDVPREELYRRIAGRLICKAHQHIYNIHARPPKIPGICDLDGSELFQRSDDRGEAVACRLDTFFHQTIEVLGYYRKQAKVFEINGNREVELVHRAIMDAICKQATAQPALLNSRAASVIG